MGDINNSEKKKHWLTNFFFFPFLLLLRKKDYTGQTALHFTSSKNNLSTARKLLAKGASARVKDKRGQIPLHRAAAIGSVPFIKLLLGVAKSPVNATDVSGYTALHHGML